VTLARLLDPSAFTQRIALQIPETALDARGQRVLGWMEVAQVWAQAQPLRGREFFAAGALQSQVEVRFRIRWRPGVDGTMRVIWRGVPYAIVGEPIDVDGARHTLELMCMSGAKAEAA
jgi:SPP1 family predicted phage head-tail adaptor